jgi:hypothetical protein
MKRTDHLRGHGDERHFQQYFCYIVTVSFIGGGNRVPGENHRPGESHYEYSNVLRAVVVGIV